MESPRAMDGCAILRSLLRRGREPSTAMDRYGQYVCRAIRQPQAAAGQRHLHHAARKIARRVAHVLVRGRDSERRRVVISAEVRGYDSSSAFIEQPRQTHHSPLVENRFRRLDHQLHLERAAIQAV